MPTTNFEQVNYNHNPNYCHLDVDKPVSKHDLSAAQEWHWYLFSPYDESWH